MKISSPLRDLLISGGGEGQKRCGGDLAHSGPEVPQTQTCLAVEVLRTDVSGCGGV